MQVDFSSNCFGPLPKLNFDRAFSHSLDTTFLNHENNSEKEHKVPSIHNPVSNYNTLGYHLKQNPPLHVTCRSWVGVTPIGLKASIY